MEAILNIVSIIIIVFGILQIILFFKLWGMTDNVKKMTSILIQIAKNNISTQPCLQKEIPKNRKKSFQTNIFPSDTWGKDITEDEENKAKSLIPKLVANEVIIKLLKSNKIVVYENEQLNELRKEDYKIIYYK